MPSRPLRLEMVLVVDLRFLKLPGRQLHATGLESIEIDLEGLHFIRIGLLVIVFRIDGHASTGDSADESSSDHPNRRTVAIDGQLEEAIAPILAGPRLMDASSKVPENPRRTSPSPGCDRAVIRQFEREGRGAPHVLDQGDAFPGT